MLLLLLGGIQCTQVESGHVDICWLSLRQVVVGKRARVEVDMVVIDDGRSLRRIS